MKIFFIASMMFISCISLFSQTELESEIYLNSGVDYSKYVEGIYKFGNHIMCVNRNENSMLESVFVYDLHGKSLKEYNYSHTSEEKYFHYTYSKDTLYQYYQIIKKDSSISGIGYYDENDTNVICNTFTKVNSEPILFINPSSEHWDFIIYKYLYGQYPVVLKRVTPRGDSIITKTIFKFEDTDNIAKSYTKNLLKAQVLKDGNYLLLFGIKAKEIKQDFVYMVFLDSLLNIKQTKEFHPNGNFYRCGISKIIECSDNNLIFDMYESNEQGTIFSQYIMKYSINDNMSVYESKPYDNTFKNKIHGLFYEGSEEIYLMFDKDKNYQFLKLDKDKNLIHIRTDSIYSYKSFLRDKDGSLYVGGGYKDGDQKATLRKYVTTSKVIDIQNNNSINIYPNPAGDRVNIEFDETLGMPESVEIYDVLGNKVNGLQVYHSSGSVIVNTLSLSTGTYTARIMLGGNVIAKSFVVGR